MNKISTKPTQSEDALDGDGAVYQESLIPQHMGNPLIEALPPEISDDEIYLLLRQQVVCNDQLRSLPDKTRMNLIYLARDFVMPHSGLLQLANAISILIRSGYTNRNPLKKDYWQKRVPNNSDVKKIRIRPKGPIKPTGQTLMGLSGTGKSYGIETVLYRMYPQVINHLAYKGQAFPFRQIVWLKINCPVDGTVKGACLRIIAAIDAILDTDYYRYYHNDSKDGLINAIGNLCSDHGIGMLVVDEIQNLVLAKGANRKELIDFFTDLENMPGLVVIKIGTYKSRHLLTEFYSARRAVNLLPPIWDRMAKDEEWTEFCKMLFEIQFTRTRIPYSEELSNLLYDISQGILDFAVKAYLFSQMRAIHNGLETISLNLIASVVIDHFKPAEKILEAIRNNDTQALANVDDVVIDFESVYQGYITKSSKKKTNEEAKQISDDKANDTGKENNKASKGKNKRQNKKAKDTSAFPAGDLRGIVADGANSNASAYETLNSAGIIKSTIQA